jgi:hypothetical protein
MIQVFDTPESLFCIRPDAPQELHLDALNAVLIRAEAVLTLLSAACTDVDEGYSVDQATIANGLWALIGMIEEAKTIVRHG